MTDSSAEGRLAQDGLTFSLLGPVRAWRDGVELVLGSPQQRMTLAVLLLGEGRTLPLDEIVATLWGAPAPSTARTTVRTYVSRLRRILKVTSDDPVIVTGGGGYAVRVSEKALDYTRAIRAASDAATARARGEQERAADLLRGALAEWQGKALADLRGKSAYRERLRLAQRRISWLEQLAVLDLELGRSAEVVAMLSTAAAEEPLRERLHELKILALLRAGHYTAARVAYDEIRQLLRRQLGVDPGPGLRALHQRMTGIDPGPQALTPARVVIPQGSPTAPAQLPADLPVFVGRKAEFEAMSAMILTPPGHGRSTPSPQVSVIHGTAGVGKTALAVHWAHHVAEHFPDGNFYVDLKGFAADDAPADPADAIAGVLTALGIAPHQLPPSTDALTALYRSLLSERRCLIVLDNARDTAQVLPLLPGNSGSCVVVTSRIKLNDLVATTAAHTVALDLLTCDEAQDFMVARLGKSQIDNDMQSTRDIVASCARLPLALAVMCARATSNPGLSLASIVAELNDARGSLDVFDGSDGVTDVRSVLSWSYRGLSESAARLFRLLSLHAGVDIGIHAGASLVGVSTVQAHTLFRELTDGHVLVESQPGRYRCHDLFRSYALELVEPHDSIGDQRMAARRYLDHYLRTTHAAARLLSTHQDLPPIDDGDSTEALRKLVSYKDALNWFMNEHHVLLAVVERAAAMRFEGHAWKIAWSMRNYLDRGAYWADLEGVGKTALRAATIADDTIGMAYSHRALAQVDSRYRRYGRARFHLERAIGYFEMKGNLLATAYTLQQACGVLEMEEDFDGALVHGAEALKLFRAEGRPAGEGATLAGTLSIQRKLGRYDEALESGRRALTLTQESGDLHDIAQVFIHLGRTFYDLGLRTEAIQHHHRALDALCDMTSQASHIPKRIHEIYISSLLDSSKSHYAAGQKEEAECALRDVLIQLAQYLVDVPSVDDTNGDREIVLREAGDELREFLAASDDADDWRDRALGLLHLTVMVLEEDGACTCIIER